MSSVVKSGAFLQQCFAVHPLSLSFKLLKLPDKVGILCTNCKMQHRLIFRGLAIVSGQGQPAEQGAVDSILKCATEHQEDLRVSGVDVVRDTVQFRCRGCKMRYQVTITAIETYQP